MATKCITWAKNLFKKKKERDVHGAWWVPGPSSLCQCPRSWWLARLQTSWGGPSPAPSRPPYLHLRREMIQQLWYIAGIQRKHALTYLHIHILKTYTSTACCWQTHTSGLTPHRSLETNRRRLLITISAEKKFQRASNVWHTTTKYQITEILCTQYVNCSFNLLFEQS